MNIHQPCGNVMPFLSGCYSIFQLLCVQFIEPRSNRCLALSLPHSQKSLPSLPIERKLYCGQDLKVPWGFYNCCRQLLKLVNSWSKLLKLWPAVKSFRQLVKAVKAANRCKKNVKGIDTGYSWSNSGCWKNCAAIFRVFQEFPFLQILERFYGDETEVWT